MNDWQEAKKMLQVKLNEANSEIDLLNFLLFVNSLLEASTVLIKNGVTPDQLRTELEQMKRSTLND